MQPLCLARYDFHDISLCLLASNGGQEQDDGDRRRLLPDARLGLRKPQLVARRTAEARRPYCCTVGFEREIRR